MVFDIFPQNISIWEELYFPKTPNFLHAKHFAQLQSYDATIRPDTIGEPEVQHLYQGHRN